MPPGLTLFSCNYRCSSRIVGINSTSNTFPFCNGLFSFLFFKDRDFGSPGPHWPELLGEGDLEFVVLPLPPQDDKPALPTSFGAGDPGLVDEASFSSIRSPRVLYCSLP